MPIEFDFEGFDAMLDALTFKNALVYDKIKELEERLKRLIDILQTEADNMWEDFKYDHDNYDSIHRERCYVEKKEEAETLIDKLYCLLSFVDKPIVEKSISELL